MKYKIGDRVVLKECVELEKYSINRKNEIIFLITGCILEKNKVLYETDCYMLYKIKEDWIKKIIEPSKLPIHLKVKDFVKLENTNEVGVIRSVVWRGDYYEYYVDRNRFLGRIYLQNDLKYLELINIPLKLMKSEI